MLPPSPKQPAMPPEWKPSMSRAAATTLALGGVVAAALYRGTDKPRTAAREGLQPRMDPEMRHAGIELKGSKTAAREQGRKVLETRAVVKKSLEVDAEFWQGTSRNPDHRKVYEKYLKLQGIMEGKAAVLRRAERGDLSKAIQAAGFDAWLTRTPAGKIKEIRVFGRKGVTVVEESVGGD